MKGAYEERCAAVGNFKQQYSPFSNTYNPATRNHPNFRWSNESHPQVSDMNSSNNQFQAPNAFNARPSLSDTLHTFIHEQQKQNQRYDTLLGQLVEENKEIKSQISKLTNFLAVNEKGKFPANTQPNPKGANSCESSLEHVKSVITLRSGKIINNTPSHKEVEKSKNNDKLNMSNLNESNEYHFPAPFPQALNPPKKLSQNSEILDVFKEVKVNIPLLAAIKQIPSYAKFLKDLCTIKRKHQVKKKAFLTEHVSALLQYKIPPKYKDPGSPTLSCVIGNNFIDRALLDLGSSVNLLPYSVYLQLGLGELKPTKVNLQLADQSVRTPRGIIEDVLVQVDKFYYPVDFIVLDTAHVSNSDNQIPVILGRPFLATCDANINCRSGVMKLCFGNMTMEVNVFNVYKQSSGEEDEPESVNSISTLSHDQFAKSSVVSCSEKFQINSNGSDLTRNSQITEIGSLFDSLQVQEGIGWKPKIDKLPPLYDEPMMSSVNEAPKVKLKLFPKSLPNTKVDTSPVVSISKPNYFQGENYSKTFQHLGDFYPTRYNFVPTCLSYFSFITH